MRAALILFLSLVTGCGEVEGDSVSAARSESYCAQQLFDGSSFTVCDPRGGRIELLAASSKQAPVRELAELQGKLGRRAEQVAFAMNAGMFDEEGRPIGLAIVDGDQVHAVNRRKGGGNFHLLPNGIFQVRRDGTAQVVPTAEWEPSDDIEFATQSGPMLVIDGKLHPKFDHDGSSRHIRNGVGIASDGRPRFVISDEPVSFGKFARLFRDGLGSRNALFFDGSVSALWDPASHRRDITVPLGPMIVAFKPAASKPDPEGRATP